MRLFSVRVLLFALIVVLSAGSSRAQTALLLSDTHFDPFHDPGKARQLAAAPVSRWETILAAPDTPTQARDFEALRAACPVRGIDTPYALFASLLRAVHTDAAGARFITLSGDLLAHSFPCLFQHSGAGATPKQYTAFTVKTIEYEMLALRRAVPGAVFYLALGNNDSNCGDYRLDTGSAWFATLAKAAASGAGSAWDKAATRSFTRDGSYNIALRSMRNTRMIVLDDIYLSTGFRTCQGKPDRTAGEHELQWLRRQLDQARARHQRVWVMGHIPPGISLYDTFQQQKKHLNLCAAEGKPALFLQNDQLSAILASHADVVKLALFGHTHLDEIKLLDGAHGAVPLKIVSSVTTINGNLPSFTVARLNPATAEMADYTVFRSPDPEGTRWSPEYTFSTEYGHKGFTPATLRPAIASLAADASGTTKLSQDYIRHWSVGARLKQLQPIWPAYVCGMEHTSADSYKQCVCRTPLAPLLGGSTR